MKILIVAATPFEITPFTEYLEANQANLTAKKIEISILITGVGQVLTTFQLSLALAQHDFDLVLNAGVAGAYNKNELNLGDVVNVVCERFADLGAEQADGSFEDVFEMNLLKKDEFPFQDGELINTKIADFDFLPMAKGLTINKVHGSIESIEKIKNKYEADIETMEGVAFFYVCLMMNVKFMQIRAISNYVEKRNKANWEMSLAIENLNKMLIEIVENIN